MRMLLVVVVAVVLAGCDQGRKSVDADCAATAAALMKIKSKSAKVLADFDRTLKNRCVQDRWSAEARACLQNVRAQHDVDNCRHKHLTGEQDEQFGPDVGDLFAADARAMAAMRMFKDKMCACKDAKCAQVVSDQMTKWSNEMATARKEPPRMSDSDMKEAASIGEAMGMCMQKAMSADFPATDDPMATQK